VTTAIPEQLRRHAQWVNWKAIFRDGREVKLPIRPDRTPASSTDPSTWCRFDQLATDGVSGIGFVFSLDDPYIGIDLDGCRDPKTGQLESWAVETIAKMATYAEVSPSKSGVKLIGTTGETWTHQNKASVGSPGHGGKSAGVEVYDRGRYFALTGKVLPGYESIADVTESLAWLAERFSMRRTQPTICGRDVASETPLVERAARYLAKMDASVSGSAGHNTAWRAACAMIHGFNLSATQALLLLSSDWNARCKPPWSQKELLHKVKQASEAPGQRGYLADATPDQWEKIVLRIGKLPAEGGESAGAEPVRRTTLASAASDYVQQLATGATPLIETGIPELDKAIGGGVAPGEMVIVAARPSHGKSAIALQMVHHMTRRGVAAVIVSEEMSSLALGKRAVQFAIDMPEREWKENHSEVADQLKDHFATRKDAIILESCGTVERVVAEVEKAVAESDAGVVVVDYVQLLKAKGNGRYEQVTAASQEMRRLASRLNVAVIVLAQLSRKVEERKKFIPMASDLKETGQLEQDADVIILGVWPHRIDAANPPEDYQFFVVKNRNRAIINGAFQCRFEPERQRLLGPKIIELSSNYEVTDEFF
jgi:KaiC/GvpD/RAD55 family RecA-like ATPase